MRSRAGIFLSIAALAALTIYLTLPLLRCPGTCFVDYSALHGRAMGNFELPDARLNAWILAWVQHQMFSDPAALFDANAFYPAKKSLTGSEHMIGVALQTLPVRLFSDGAVTLHQSALILSFLLLGLTTFAFVHWVTGSSWAALLAAAAAAFMPWRMSEVSHLQLLSAQWIPLAWMLTARVLCGDRSRRDAFWLTVVLAIQMLSSFYLAYFVLLSCALFAATLLVAERPPRTAVYQLGGALLLSSALVALTSLPYLARYSGYRFAETPGTELVTTPGVMLAFLAPTLSLWADHERMATITYHLPPIVALCAVLALGWLLPIRARDAGRERRIRVVTLGMAIVSLAAFVLMLGRELVVGGVSIPLPAQWLARVVPGFSQLRAEFRWGILIGIACPVMAGLGVAGVERASERIARASLRGLPKPITRVCLAVLFALAIPWRELPARGSWEDAEDILDAHRALATLEPGPVVEIPWRSHPIDSARSESLYMLASSLHFRPTLNGYTAYLPTTHQFLQRIAGDLPRPRAVENLRRMAGVRWIIVHPARLAPPEARRWALAEESGLVTPTAALPGARIYEVPPAPTSEIWLAALRRDEPGPTTMTGLPRAPLALPERPGTLRVDVPALMRFEPGSGLVHFAAVEIANRSAVTWPGLDIWTEGLVRLRYRCFDAEGALIREASADFDADVPPARTTKTRAVVRPPAKAGRYRMRFDVVQRLGEELRALGIPAVERQVEVVERGRLPEAHTGE